MSKLVYAVKLHKSRIKKTKASNGFLNNLGVIAWAFYVRLKDILRLILGRFVREKEQSRALDHLVAMIFQYRLFVTIKLYGLAWIYPAQFYRSFLADL